MKKLFAIVLVAVTSVTQSLCGQTSETACRSAVSDNYAYAWDRGTASGRPDDLIAIRDCFGRIVACRSIRDWAADRGPYVYEVAVHSGGNWSIRFCYFAFTAANPFVQGGSVEVIRSGQVVDRDPLR